MRPLIPAPIAATPLTVLIVLAALTVLAAPTLPMMLALPVPPPPPPQAESVRSTNNDTKHRMAFLLNLFSWFLIDQSP